MARRKSKLSSDECKKAILSYFQTQKKFKRMQTRFGEIKADFYNDMEDFFNCNNIDGKLTIELDEEFADVEKIVVTRIQNSKVEFNPDKLEKVLGKELSQNVIQKQYEIVNIEGLISCLRDCGVSSKMFRNFISIRKFVNVKELEKLEELGQISAEQIKGCYSIKSQSPYFTVNAGRGQGNECK